MSKFRLEITKGEELRYISHLDYAGAIERAVRRSKLPAAYSEGFNPHMKIAFASAMGLGITTSMEYMEIEIKEDMPVEEVKRCLGEQLPPGINLLQIKELQGRTQSLMSMVELAEYDVKAPLTGTKEQAEAAVKAFNEAEQVDIIRWSPKKGEKVIALKQYVEKPVTIEFAGDDVLLKLSIKSTLTGSAKSGEVVKALQEQFALPINNDEVFINRTGIFCKGKKLMEL